MLLCMETENGEVDLEISKEALDFLGIDENGLDENDRKYLKLLVKKFGGKAVGITTISSALSESKNSIEEIIEPYLIREGYIHKTPKGRIPTKKAFQLFKK